MRSGRRGTAPCPSTGSEGRDAASAAWASASGDLLGEAPLRRSSSRSTNRSCRRLPAAARTICPPEYARACGTRRGAARHARDDLRSTDDRSAERMRPEDGLGGEVVDEILRRVLDHRDLLEHHLSLGVDVGERREEDHVDHHVDRPLEAIVGNPRVDHGRLARRGDPALHQARRRSRRSPAPSSATTP